ncbi:MAG: hypothetical protein Gaeavirus2_6 [Gaeavirus sp.]|uniref:Uncharacterized protein n=1 Tax=Gaeavirus sp. TaxID=2487767 RepID=A0A3G5A084_9VIRU|nr:MAG: hypothetical protein Gaeavirus2_6 [Gaeavirus sp.]
METTNNHTESLEEHHDICNSEHHDICNSEQLDEMFDSVLNDPLNKNILCEYYALVNSNLPIETGQPKVNEPVSDDDVIKNILSEKETESESESESELESGDEEHDENKVEIEKSDIDLLSNSSERFGIMLNYPQDNELDESKIQEVLKQMFMITPTNVSKHTVLTETHDNLGLVDEYSDDMSDNNTNSDTDSDDEDPESSESEYEQSPFSIVPEILNGLKLRISNMFRFFTKIDKFGEEPEDDDNMSNNLAESSELFGNVVEMIECVGIEKS